MVFKLIKECKYMYGLFSFYIVIVLCYKFYSWLMFCYSRFLLILSGGFGGMYRVFFCSLGRSRWF